MTDSARHGREAAPSQVQSVDRAINSLDARRARLTLEGQFLGNAEAWALRLDASFRTFVQGDLSVGEFCRRMKEGENH